MQTKYGKFRDKRQKVGVKGIVSFPFSFESNEQGATPIYFPMPVKITKIRAVAQKAIAGSDNGTLTGANATGNSTGGVATFTASDAIATEKTATPTTNNTVAAGSYYKVTSAKSTAGGKGVVTLEFETI